MISIVGPDDQEHRLLEVILALPWRSMTFRELPLIRGASEGGGDF